jgi:hypothetical protein
MSIKYTDPRVLEINHLSVFNKNCFLKFRFMLQQEISPTVEDYIVNASLTGKVSICKLL